MSILIILIDSWNNPDILNWKISRPITVKKYYNRIKRSTKIRGAQQAFNRILVIGKGKGKSKFLAEFCVKLPNVPRYNPKLISETGNLSKLRI